MGIFFKKHRWFIGVALVICALFAVTTHFLPAHAAPSAQWINKATILYDGIYYTDRDTTDDTYQYVGTPKDTQGCTASIEFRQDDIKGDSQHVMGFFYGQKNIYSSTQTQDASHGTLVMPVPNKDSAGNKDCGKTNTSSINLTDTSNRRITFVKTDDTTIVSFNGNYTFKQSSGNSKLFIRQNDPNSKCKDLIFLATARAAGPNDEIWDNYKDVAGSSVFYAVADSQNASGDGWGYHAESYGDVINNNSLKGTKWCGEDYEDVTLNDRYAIGSPMDGASDNGTVQQLIASGINSSGQPYTDGDRSDDAFVVFVGGPENFPKDANGNPESPPANNNSGSGDTRPVCSLDNNFAWILCPLIATTDSVLTEIESLIQQFLQVPPLQAVTSNPIYAIWNVLRNLANIIFIIAFMIIVFSQATSVGISNYGIKRLLPRLVAVAILANISFPIAAFIVDAGNLLQAGIQNLALAIMNQAQGLQFSATGLDIPAGNGPGPGASLGLLGLGGGLLAFLIKAKGFEVMVVPILIGVLIVIVAIVALVFRVVIIDGLAMASAVIVVLLLLPNTESRGFKLVKLYVQLNLWGGIIMFLFVAGQVGATVLVATIPTNAGSVVRVIIYCGALVAKYAAIAVVPLGFGVSGTLVGSALTHGRRLAKRGGGAYENTRGRKYRKDAREQYKQRQYVEDVTNGQRKAFGVVPVGRLRRGLFRAGAATLPGQARQDLTEQLAAQQHKYEDQRLSTARTALARDGGVNSALLAQMDKGESVNKFQERIQKEQGRALNADELESLNTLQGRYGSQIGDTTFRTAAVMTAQKAGADVADVKAATHSLVTGMQDSGMSNNEITNHMLGVVGPNAKDSGFAPLKYAGLDRNGNYNEFGTKTPEAVASNINLTGLEKQQIVGANGQLTEFGQGLMEFAKHKPIIAAGRIAEAMRLDTKGDIVDEFTKVNQLVQSSGAADTGNFIDEVNRMIQRKQ